MPAFFHLGETIAKFNWYCNPLFFYKKNKIPQDSFTANRPLMIARTISIYKASFSGLSREAWLLSFVSLINRSGTMVIPFLTIYLTEEKGWTLGQASWAMMAFGIGSVAGSYSGGVLTDRIGYYPVQFWSLLLGGIMFILLQFTEGLWQTCAMIFMVSVSSEAFRPATMSGIGAYSKPENRMRSISLLRLAINLGYAVGPAMGGLLSDSFSWSAVFWADGLTCIAAAFAFRAFLPKKEPDKVESKTEQANAPSPWKDRRYLAFLMILLLTAIAFMQFLSTLPVFYRQDMGLSKTQIGILTTINGLLIVLLELPLVNQLEGRRHRLDYVRWGALLYGLSYLVFQLPGAPILIALLSIVIITFGEILNMPFSNAYAMTRSEPANRGRYMGMFSMTYSVSNIFAPLVGMQIAARWGFGILWYAMAGLCVVAYGGYVWLKKSEGKS